MYGCLVQIHAWVLGEMAGLSLIGPLQINVTSSHFPGQTLSNRLRLYATGTTVVFHLALLLPCDATKGCFLSLSAAAHGATREADDLFYSTA